MIKLFLKPTSVIISLIFLLNNSGIEIVLAEEKDPITAISTIRQLLNATLIEYKNMNYTGATDLVDIAYIDNYEYVEDPLKEKDNKLMKTTEDMLRKDLSKLIDEKSSYKDVELIIANIEKNLDKAESLLKTN